MSLLFVLDPISLLCFLKTLEHIPCNQNILQSFCSKFQFNPILVRTKLQQRMPENQRFENKFYESYSSNINVGGK